MFSFFVVLYLLSKTIKYWVVNHVWIIWVYLFFFICSLVLLVFWLLNCVLFILSMYISLSLSLCLSLWLYVCAWDTVSNFSLYWLPFLHFSATSSECQYYKYVSTKHIFIVGKVIFEPFSLKSRLNNQGSVCQKT